MVMTRNEEKIWDYLVTHKRPVLAQTLAKRFLMSKSRVSAALKKFAEHQIVDMTKVGSSKFYRVKE